MITCFIVIVYLYEINVIGHVIWLKIIDHFTTITCIDLSSYSDIIFSNS